MQTFTHTLHTYIQKQYKRFIAPSKRVYQGRINLMGIRFLNTTMQHALELIESAISKRKKANIYYVNADTLNKCYLKPSLQHLFNKTPYIFPDGSGVKLACSLMKRPLRKNLNGTDMLPHICDMAAFREYKIFLYGAKEGVALKMKNKLIERYPDLQIVGTLNGYDVHTNEAVNMMNHTKADIVLVAKGAPYQEEWIEENSRHILAPVVIGVGGLFDFYSGNIPRAPLWMRRLGIEWMYRLRQEPGRMFARYILGNPLFLLRSYIWNAKEKAQKLQGYKNIFSFWDTDIIAKYVNRSKLDYYTYRVSKRVLDMSVASTVFFLLLPLLSVVSLLIKLESRGSVFFHQIRVGRNGKHFKMYKFRSMVEDAEKQKKEISQENESKDGVIFKMKEDPRITKIGKFIRKWSIDELPQLWNVLIGDMSLVGPRPPVPSEVQEYVSDDLKRLHITPGITCYWQIAGRSEIPFKQQVDLDKKYISSCGLWTDIKILFGTIPAVLAHKGAY